MNKRTSWNKGLSWKTDKRVARPWLGKKRPDMVDNGFKKGCSPWNKGLVGYNAKEKNPNWKGKVALRGSKNPNWKGENVGKEALHTWVYRSLGKPKCCSQCGKITKWIDWANVDHRYKRNLDDFIALCRSCHRKHDYQL
jgi:hypothetical protein